MPDVPATMRALVGTASGDDWLDKLEVVSDRPVPKAGSANALPASLHPVLVKVEYAALNPVDYKMLASGMFINSWPYCAAIDFAGTVAEVASGTKWAVGDRVWGFSGIGSPGSGTLAEYCSVPGDCLSAIPAGVAPAAASGLGCTGMTAAAGLWMNLGLDRDFSEGNKDTTVVVWGAAASVGQYAVQLAKHAGYRVVGIASKKHHERIQSQLGADQMFDYHDKDFIHDLAADPKNKGLKHVFDAIGATVTADCFKLLANCGTTGGTVTTVHPPSEQSDEMKAKMEPGGGLIPVTQLFNAQNPEDRTIKTLMRGVDALLAGGKLVLNDVTEFDGLVAGKQGLQKLAEGKTSAEKVVVKVA